MATSTGSRASASTQSTLAGWASRMRTSRPTTRIACSSWTFRSRSTLQGLPSRECSRGRWLGGVCG
eukprot:2755311-Alexandrium_andersonii.AAC.1